MAGAVGRALRRFFLGAPDADPPMRLDADAEIAVHVAVHAARTRGQPAGVTHLVYGLLQDDEIRAAIERLGGDALAIEHRALDEMDGAAAPGNDDARRAVTVALALGHSHGRATTCADLWSQLIRTDAGRLVEAGGVAAIDVLFALAHGRAQGPNPPAPRERVMVVLRNDDYTTQELVVAVLRDVFALAPPDAVAVMESVHRHGRGTVGPLAAAEARDKIATVRALARERGFPLWIAVDDF